MSVSAEWEATKNSEPAKEVTSQPVNTETTAASNTEAETYNQQVTMMPVQVLRRVCQSVHRMLTGLYMMVYALSHTSI